MILLLMKNGLNINLHLGDLSGVAPPLQMIQSDSSPVEFTCAQIEWAVCLQTVNLPDMASKGEDDNDMIGVITCHGKLFLLVCIIYALGKTMVILFT